MTTQRKPHWRAALLFSLVLTSGAVAMTPEQRREYRDRLVQILPDVPAFNAWIRSADELPPDYDVLPRQNGLPDPLMFFDGRPVKSPEDWKNRRDEIRKLFEKYAWGSVPPQPKLVSADVQQETPSDGYRTRSVVLHFGPDGKATMRVSLIIPDGNGALPVIMGPGLIGGFGNTAGTLLRRRYITASYAGSDFSDDSRAAAEHFPGFDLGALPRRAWAASVAVDYLLTLPEVDAKRIAIYGYSRDGKQAMIAAALDERIAAVIAGSTGVGGVLPYRLAGERNHAEGIESTTRMFPDWFHPRLRFFAGREDRFPVDGNLLLAMVAPRPCIMVSGFNDEVANTWGDEQSLHSAMKVYELLGAGGKLGLLRVPGFHGANDMEQCLDFLDIQFGLSTRRWTNQFVFPWDFEQWQQRTGEKMNLVNMPDQEGTELPTDSTEQWKDHAAAVRAAIQMMMGTAPPMMAPGGGGRGRGGGGRGPASAPGRGGATTGPAGNPGQTTPDLVNWVIQRSLRGSQEFGWHAAVANQVASRDITFGYGVRGQLYYPANVAAGTKLPTVIWLHGYSYPLGYMWVYHRDLHPVLAMVKSGYAVLAFDQIGFGSRMREATAFHDRWPHWSLMGRMVEDVRAAVGTLQRDSQVDPQRIYLFGYSLGGNVALHATVLDDRIKGVVSICGFTPMRTDTPDRGAGGLARYSTDRPLLPRLGFYIGHESKLPYDYDEIIAAIAPRPVYVVQSQFDRDANVADVRAAVERARRVYALYNASDSLRLDEPWDYNRLPTVTQDRIIEWMKQTLK